MLFRQTLVKEGIPHRPRKGDIHDPTGVNVPDLRASKAELAASKSMRLEGNFRPGADLLFEQFQIIHDRFRCRPLPLRFTPRGRLFGRGRFQPSHGSRSSSERSRRFCARLSGIYQWDRVRPLLIESRKHRRTALCVSTKVITLTRLSPYEIQPRSFARAGATTFTAFDRTTNCCVPAKPQPNRKQRALGKRHWLP